MVTMRLGEIFTEVEIKQMTAMVASGVGAKRIAAEIIQPVMSRIDADTGQQNDALYLAYAILYQIENAMLGKGTEEGY